jgi:hypothetical protein
MLGLLLFAAGAVVGLVAGNKEVREKVNQKSKELLNRV